MDSNTVYRSDTTHGTRVAAAVGAADVIYGGAGDDWIEGGQGNDFIDAGADNDGCIQGWQLNGQTNQLVTRIYD